MIKPPQFVEQFHVAWIFFEQRPQRENADLRPASRDRGFFQRQICLSMVRFIFQNLFDHFHRALRGLLNLALRFHHCERRSRNVEETFFAAFLFRDLGPAQQLATGEKLRLLFQNSLQQRDCVAEIAQLYRRHRFQPQTVLRFIQLFFGLNRHASF